MNELLPYQQWLDWLRHNLQRGCLAADLWRDMKEKGGLDHAIIVKLFAAAEAPLHAASSDINTLIAPKPAVSGNSVSIAGHEIQIALHLKSPEVIVFDNVLTADECRELISAGESKLTRATVVGEDGQPVLHPERRSDGAGFQRGESPLLATIEQRLATLVDWPVEHGEGIQVLRYTPGGEYKAHYDWFDVNNPAIAARLGHGGQRVATLVLYLNEVDEGGATEFPELGLSVRPRTGRALYFSNVDEQGRSDRRTLHAGAPVRAGVKYIATKWLRQRPYI